jgi:hypothetical protein
MKPNISEFSYGYALTEELIKGLGPNITAAPVFPSLYQEGRKGGGWDVKLQRGGIPLFIQFKLSHYLKSANAKERKSGHFSTPYYRMHIRPKKHSKQHELLLDLENLGHEVYYAAPVFHEPAELNDAYLKKQVKNMSLWVKPTDIGTITDDKKHYLVFQLPHTWSFCSKPKTIERNLSFLTFSENINNSLNQRQETALTKDSLRKLVTNLAKIGRRKTDIFLKEDVLTEEVLSNRHPIEMVSYYSSIYFGSQLIILQKASEI